MRWTCPRSPSSSRVGSLTFSFILTDVLKLGTPEMELYSKRLYVTIIQSRSGSTAAPSAFKPMNSAKEI